MTDEAKIEHSAGCVLMRAHAGRAQALLIRFRGQGYELPKGHIEPGESPAQAALRELAEETGIANRPRLGPQIDHQTYSFRHRNATIEKDVIYFLATISDGERIRFGAIRDSTQELRWVERDDLETVVFKHDGIRNVIERAFELFEQTGPTP